MPRRPLTSTLGLRKLPMSIRSFIDAAIESHAAGKYDVALALACAAVDATAAKLYPSEKSNAARYKAFLKRAMRTITLNGFPGIQASEIRIKCRNVPDLKTDEFGYVGIEDIIYHTLRCGLVHQCEIDTRIVFTERTEIGDFESSFRVPRQLVLGLIKAVTQDESNCAEFQDEASQETPSK